MEHNTLIKKAIECGATKATVIDVENIVLSAHFRAICETNACGGCGRSWMCPPEIPPIENLMANVRKHRKALVFQTVTELEDSFDIETMGKAGKNLTELCLRLKNEIGNALGENILVLGAGGCRVCTRCAKIDNLPCRRPEDALLSLEACGIDVYNTVKNTELKYINGENTVTFFGMILFG